MKNTQWMSRAICATALATALCTTASNAQVLTEAFDTTTIPPTGWSVSNQSQPLGGTGWFQNNAVFPPQAGAGAINANFNNGGGLATISNWLLSPTSTIQQNGAITFWTRTVPAPFFPDRLQVRVSTAGTSTNTGTSATDVGVFGTLVLDINPSYTTAGYPNVYTLFTVNLTAVQVPTPGTGRVAFRYFVENGGPAGANSDFIGIDTFGYNPGTVNNCLNPLNVNCPTNVDVSGGSATQTDINDLLAVINTWGQTGPPRPQGDCDPLPNGNCTVNINDLLAVINAWGSCIPATGRCCTTVCLDGQTLAQCNAAGGLWGGADTNCAAFTCPIVNDNCDGALVMTVAVAPPPVQMAVNNGTTTGATDSGGATLMCATSPTMTRDVWYKHTVPTTPGLLGQQVRVNLCGTAFPFTDTVLALYEGTCAGLTQVACSDDSCFLLSEINTPQILAAGATLYIRVGSKGVVATNQGPFVLRALVTNVTSDVCAGAETLAVGGSDTDTLAAATQDFGPSCPNAGCTPPQNNNVSAGVGRWYRVIGNGQTLTVSTCTSASGVYDGKLSVYCGPNCSGLNCKAATDCDVGQAQLPACPAFQGERVSFCTSIGQLYFVLVGANNVPGGEPAPYTVTLTTNGISCTNNPAEVCGPPPPPANDECLGAISVPVGTTNFNTATALPTTAAPWCGTTGSKDIWFTYTSANGGTVKLQFAGTAPYTDGICSVYTAASTCAALSELVCVDDPVASGTCLPCGGCHPCIEFTAVAGSTYRFRVGSWDVSGGGAGSVTITDP